MIKILVCVKEVVCSGTQPEIDFDNTWVRPSGGHGFRMNMYDEYALEEAVKIKEENPGTVVDILSAGPERAGAILKKGLEKGADSAFRFHVENGGYITPFQKASILSSFAAPRGYSLIFTGVMSEDLMNGQVGPMTAALLNIPFAASVVREALDIRGACIDVESEIEGGMRALYRLKLPALLAIQSGINMPRYPSLSNKLRAKYQKIEIVNDEGTSIAAARERIHSICYPEKISRGIVIEGTRSEKAEKLLQILHEKSFL